QCILPPLALGVTATAVAATNGLSVLALSDGRIVFAGQPGSLASPPTAAAGQHFTHISCTPTFGAGLSSDGDIHVWGALGTSWVPVGPPPAGATFVSVSAYHRYGIARLSDGSAIAFGDAPYLPSLRPLAAREGYLQVVAGPTVVSRVGAKATFTHLADGCPGTHRASRIVPQDTPTVGGHLTARIHDLPQSVCLLTLGLSEV